MFLIEPDKGNNYFLSDSSSFHFLSFSILLKSLYYEKRGSTGGNPVSDDGRDIYLKVMKSEVIIVVDVIGTDGIHRTVVCWAVQNREKS